MPFFICLDLVLGFLIQTHSRYQVFFLSEWSNYLGIVCVILAVSAMLAHKFSLSLRYDLFCCGCVLIWISTWPPFFNEDSPVIFFYPIYFCFITVFVTIGFIQQAPKIDVFTLSFMEKFNNLVFFNTYLLMGIVLVSLNLVENYLLFPTVMTLLLTKYAFSNILESAHNRDLTPDSSNQL